MNVEKGGDKWLQQYAVLQAVAVQKKVEKFFFSVAIAVGGGAVRMGTKERSVRDARKVFSVARN